MRTSTPEMRGETERRVVRKLVGRGPESGVCRCRRRRCDDNRDRGDDKYDRGTGTPNHRVRVHDGTLPAYALARMNDPGRAPRFRHPIVRVLGALALALTFVVTIFAAGASAHAVLLSESPRASSTVKEAPTQLELTFSENVEISFGSIKVFNEKGDRVDIGVPRHAASPPHTVVASLPDLEVGAYVVTWRVVSADAHPVHGGFTFTVGNSSENADKLAAELESKADGSQTVGVLFAIARRHGLRWNRAVAGCRGVRGCDPSGRPAAVAGGQPRVGWLDRALRIDDRRGAVTRPVRRRPPALEGVRHVGGARSAQDSLRAHRGDSPRVATRRAPAAVGSAQDVARAGVVVAVRSSDRSSRSQRRPGSPGTPTSASSLRSRSWPTRCTSWE